MSRRPVLRALAQHLGILDGYFDQSGTMRRTSDEARLALLAAMGIDAADEAVARDVLAAADDRRTAVLPPVCVAERNAARTIAAGGGWRGVRAWSAEVDCEDGQQLRAAAVVRRGRAAPGRLPPLPLGYHRLRLVWRDARGAERMAEQRRIVVPTRCLSVRDRLGPRRVYGMLANLYSLRSATNWGFGDLTDLGRLVAWAAEVGAAFVGVNPLHALHNRGEHISPYAPVSRIYRNPLYVDVAAVPEWRALTEAERASLADAGALRALRAADRIDYAAVRERKEAALAALHRVFVDRERGRPTWRGRAYAAYLQREGETLRAFATYVALHDHFAARGRAGSRDWPAAYRDPSSAAVRAFAAQNAELIDRHCYVQFELERQLGVVARQAAPGGLGLGIYQDLAIGSAREGSDVWSFPGLFLTGASIGAPPDHYSPTGQNWQLPPLDPRALAASGYEYWIRLVRAALQHAGALRIDHVMGLFRQYWIAEDGDATRGAYVRFPSADLLGILALESRRARALVIGEDLGTVPRGLPAVLARWRILSTRVLYFERTRRGGFRPARRYPRRALVGANTHDLVPLAGYWEGCDVALRQERGLMTDAQAAAAAAARERDRAALVRRLRADRLLPRRGGVPSELAVRAAVHAFLGRTPAALAGVSLDDCTGERTPVNLPGVARDRYPSWSRRMQMPIERLATDPAVARALDHLPSGPRSRHVRTRRRRRVTRAARGAR